MLNNAIDVQDLLSKDHKEIEHHQAKSAIVGKDILELISVSMYVDPLTMYREYIQNAADAIDIAVSEGTIKDVSEGKISINLSLKDRSVRIRDNGCGINLKNFETVMLSFGNSGKRGQKARGFRGVGRFSGLAYCQRLTFRTHAKNEAAISEVSWDGRKFKQILSNNQTSSSLEELVREVATVATYKAKKTEEAFFEIELEKVIRTKNDLLLNTEQVFDYVAQNCPVPYSDSFSFKDELENLLLKNNVQPGYDMSVSDDFAGNAKIVRPNKDNFNLSETETDKILGIKRFQLESVNEGISAIGWIYKHNYKGVIPLSENMRGIRVRVGNMQIGDEKILSDAFPEVRFNSWSMGEIHILDEKIVPNGRRDNFEHNIHWLELQNKFSPFAKEIAKTCRRNSSERNAIKIFLAEVDKCNHLISLLEQGALSKSKLKEQKMEVTLSLTKLEKLSKVSYISIANQKKLSHKLKIVRDQVNAIIESEIDNQEFFECVPKSKQTTVKEMFDLIYECSANKIVAESLIGKIMTTYAAKQLSK